MDPRRSITIPAISPASPGPLYEQIVEGLKREIGERRLRPGAPLPSFRQLAAELMVSVITVNGPTKSWSTRASSIESRGWAPSWLKTAPRAAGKSHAAARKTSCAKACARRERLGSAARSCSPSSRSSSHRDEGGNR